MDAVNEPGVQTIVLMKSAQVGYTEILLNLLGYYISQDPSPILMVQPTLEMAESFSKIRIAPMLRDTPALAGSVSEARTKDSNNTLLAKTFPGGHFVLAGANSPAGLSSRPIRIVLCDEVDRFPATAGAEGDPVNLAVKRSTTFHNRRIVIGSTPTIKGASRIELAFEQSDQRRYYVPCPHCGTFHVLWWRNVKWPEHDPSCAYMACEDCGAVIEEKHKAVMLKAGEWRAERECTGTAGFHINELYSPWRRWSDVAKDFLAAKQSPETLKTWINTSLGECWEEEAEKSDPENLMIRRENYGGDSLPDTVRYLTAGVDVQDDRLEAEIVGWHQASNDAPPESWGVEYRVIHGDPAKSDVWNDLDVFLRGTYRTSSGRKLRVMAACVDSGGHHTAQVYAYCAERKGQHFYACKGAAGNRPLWTGKKARSKKYRAELWHIGSDTGKDAWYSRLRVKEPGPGYCHFPLAYDRHFFDMLTSEQVRTKYFKGHPVREWFLPPNRRNEPLDIRVLALAALMAARWIGGRCPALRPKRNPPRKPSGARADSSTDRQASRGFDESIVCRIHADPPRAFSLSR